MDLKQSQIVFEQFSSLPLAESARFEADGSISVVTSSKDYCNYKRSKCVTRYRDRHAISSSRLDDTIVLQSDKHGLTIIFTSKEDAQQLEIWQSARLLVVKKLDDLHGTVYSDEAFGTNLGKDVAWHPNLPCFLYVAEKKKEKDATDYIPNFGDSLSTKEHPQTFLVDLSVPYRPQITCVISSEEDGTIAYGQPIFADTRTIVATGYVALKDKRRVGIIYCQNRLAQLFQFHVDLKNPTCLKGISFTAVERSCRFPRSNSHYLVYLSNKIGGAHGSCNQLHIVTLPINSSAPAKVLEEVSLPEDDEAFPGLYVDQIQPHPFLSTTQDTYVLLASAWRSLKAPLLISLTDLSVQCLAPFPKAGYCEPEHVLSYKVLAAHESIAVLARSSLIIPEEIVTVCIGTGAKRVLTAERGPDLDSGLQQILDQVAVAIVQIPDALPTEVILTSNNQGVIDGLKILADERKAIVCLPKASNHQSSTALPPLISIPHGGPHMAVSTAWTPTYLGEVLAGHTVANINFVGSTGFGQANVEKLLGAVSEVDVASVRAVQKYLVKTKVADSNISKQFIEGLSHGGFLTAHMTSKYPDSYGAAILRNPAIDIAAMALHSSDIPDWAFAESGLAFDPLCTPIKLTSKHFDRISAVSPIHAVEQVKCPSLILLSANDMRVSPTQGKAWYHGLTAAGNTRTACKIYKGEIHALDGVEAEEKAFLATLEWYASVNQSS